MEIIAARNADGPAVKQLLEHADLPTSDLTAESLAHVLVLRDGPRVLGAVGLELAGDVALLRSLVVSDAARGRGLGRDLVRAAEALAATRGVRRLYLLTTTAAAFFAAQGYAPADRAQAPASIRSTSQFSSLCPASSAFMTRALA